LAFRYEKLTTSKFLGIVFAMASGYSFTRQ
jgi:hypothetical protein